LRFWDLEILAARGDVTNLLTQVAALLLAFSFVLAMFKSRQYYLASETYSRAQIAIAALSDQEFLISTTMAVVGLFAVLMWDNLFPSRSDCLVLGHLPVRMRTLFSAKVAAIATALAFTLVSVNLFTGLAYPALIQPGGFLGLIQSYAVHAAVILAGAIFLFCSLLAIQGLALHMLSYRRFLQLSSYLQFGAFFVIIAAFLLMPPYANPRDLAAPEHRAILNWLPSFWFLGLYQELRNPGNPLFAWLAARALWSLAIVVPLAAATYVLSYGRHVRRVVEQAGVIPPNRARASTAIGRIAARLVTRRPLDRALLLFIGRTLVRSREHRMLLALYLGTGTAVALAYLRSLLYHEGTSRYTEPNTPMLAASLVLLCVCFAMPVELRANWIFRITEVASLARYQSAIRKALLLLGPVPLWLVSAAIVLALWPWKLALAHLAILALIAILLVERCLSGFEKIPFTCSYLPGKANLKVKFGAYAILFLFLSYAAVFFEQWSFENLSRFSRLILALALFAWWSVRRSRAATAQRAGLTFEQQPTPEVLGLGLHGDQPFLVHAPLSD
jgi:hypothetical protein